MIRPLSYTVYCKCKLHVFKGETQEIVHEPSESTVLYSTELSKNNAENPGTEGRAIKACQSMSRASDDVNEL